MVVVWPHIYSGKLVMAVANKKKNCRDLKGNQFSGFVPTILVGRSRAGLLTLMYALI